MKALRKRFVWMLTLVLGITGIIGGLLFYNMLPQEYFVWYPAIPLFYYLMGILFVWILKNCKNRSDHQLLNIYLAMRLVKFFMTLLFIGIYMWCIDEKDKEFVITIVIFYFIYLVVETGFYFEFEKSLKKRKTNEELTK